MNNRTSQVYKPCQSEIEEFAEGLRQLRSGAGNPSFRKMAGASGYISHTTLHEAVGGVRMPSWETTREFVRACGGDEARWKDRWQVLRSPSAGNLPVPMPRAMLQLVPEPLELERATELVVESVPATPQPSFIARHRRAVAIVAVLVLVASMSGVYLMVQGSSAPTISTSTSDTPVDVSKFISDVTIPDGTVVKPGAQFSKTWAIENAGSTVWHLRYLQRQEPILSGSCVTPTRVLVGDTKPGEVVNITVEVTAPTIETTCFVGWKMVDNDGNPFFPTDRPVFFKVTVKN